MNNRHSNAIVVVKILNNKKISKYVIFVLDTIVLNADLIKEFSHNKIIKKI
jgi:hypothetical protein